MGMSIHLEPRATSHSSLIFHSSSLSCFAWSPPEGHKELSCHGAGRESCIHIDDLDAETVSLMLQYIYGDLPSQLSVWSTVLLYLAADKYQLGSLLFQCREALALTISLENCFDVARLADAHSDSELEQV